LKKLILFIFLVSCASNALQDHDPDAFSPTPEGVYVCHNPDTEQHGKLCSEECLNLKSQSTEGSPFCWLLSESDCQDEPVLEWQKQNCHFFE
tara:strand:+ start:215 stop:490 length:276 start_codon:yes stop_codon:yes gene_type:complete